MKTGNPIKWLLQTTRTIYFRIIFSALIIVLLLVTLPLSEVWDAARRVSILTWVFLVIAFLIIHLIGVIKWRFIVGMGRIKIPYTIAIHCYFYGLFGNLFLPSLVGGDLVRTGMAVRHVEEKEQIIIGSIVDRLLDVCSLLAIFMLGVMVTAETLSDPHRKILVSIFSILLFLLMGCITFALIPIPERIPKKILGIIVRTRLVIRYLIKNPVYALGSFSLSVLMQGSFVLLNAFLGSICGIKISVLTWFVIWPLAKISALVPISLGGIGVREVALAALLAPFGVLYTTAIGYGFVWEAVLIAGSLIGFAISHLSIKDILSKKRLITDKSMPS